MPPFLLLLCSILVVASLSSAMPLRGKRIRLFWWTLLIVLAAALNFPVALWFQKKWTDGKPERFWHEIRDLDLPGPAEWPSRAERWPPPLASAFSVNGSTQRNWGTQIRVVGDEFVPEFPKEGRAAPHASRSDVFLDSGLPFRSLRTIVLKEHWKVPPPPGYTPRPFAIQALELIGERWPFRPLVLGFVGNTIVYAAAIWSVVYFLPVGLPRVVAREAARRRARRMGRCPTCSYTREGLAPGAACPECGWAGSSQSCPGCGYNRAGIAPDAPCPECGERAPS